MGLQTVQHPPPTSPGWSDPSGSRRNIPNACTNDRTAAEHTRAVSQVISLMREQLDAPHRLHDIARTALMSPFHFHRVFRLTTMTTPGRFLTALRMSEAKRMLMDTTTSATEISVLVGYSSFGTFTTQFTKLVGLPPGRFRRRAQLIANARFTDMLARSGTVTAAGAAHGTVSARPDGSPGVAIVALYGSEIAAQLPLACTTVVAPGRVRLSVPNLTGTFSVLAASVDAEARLGPMLAGTACAGMYVGMARVTLPGAAADRQTPQFSVRLRRFQVTDPPLLTAFPLLLQPDRDHT